VRALPGEGSPRSLRRDPVSRLVLPVTAARRRRRRQLDLRAFSQPVGLARPGGSRGLVGRGLAARHSTDRPALVRGHLASLSARSSSALHRRHESDRMSVWAVARACQPSPGKRRRLPALCVEPGTGREGGEHGRGSGRCRASCGRSYGEGQASRFARRQPPLKSGTCRSSSANLHSACPHVRGSPRLPERRTY